MLDHVQHKLIEAAGMRGTNALNECKLAPLSSRLDIALLGLIHRTVLGKGPRQCHNFPIERPIASWAQWQTPLIEQNRALDGLPIPKLTSCRLHQPIDVWPHFSLSSSSCRYCGELQQRVLFPFRAARAISLPSKQGGC